MKKIILFGAGSGGENYISTNKSDLILAVADNDVSKQGKKILNVNIIKPEDIKKFDYDEVVITSDWVSAISSQLITTYGINKENIVVPKKWKIKGSLPFKNIATKKLAEEWLIKINQIIVDNNIDAFISSGTLLGLARDGGIIEWDDDIDFAVSQKDYEKLKVILLSLIPKINPKNYLINLTAIKMQGTDVCLCIIFSGKSEDIIPFEIAIQKFLVEEKYAHFPANAAIPTIPKCHYLKHQDLYALDVKFRAPYNLEGYLTFVYGNWKIPQKSTTMSDYENRLIENSASKNSISITKEILL